MIFPLEMRVSTTACSQLKSVIPKMTECKLRSGINWQGLLNQKGHKTNRNKKGLSDTIHIYIQAHIQLQCCVTLHTVTVPRYSST